MRKFIVLPMAFILSVIMVTPAFAVVWDSEVNPTPNVVTMQGYNISWVNTVSTPNSSKPDEVVYTQSDSLSSNAHVSMTGSSASPYFTYDLSGIPERYPVSSAGGVSRYGNIPQLVVSGPRMRVVTGIKLPAGYYEVRFSSAFYLTFEHDKYLNPAIAYSWYFTNSSGSSFVPYYSSDGTTMMVDLPEPATLIVNVSFPTIYTDNSIQSGSSGRVLRYRFLMQNASLKYRQVESSKVTALDAANTDAHNSLEQNNELEAQWVGTMNDNFNALNLANFSWDSGLTGAFSLITDIFMRLWSTMGKFNIVYVFPLTLSVVLLLIGRLSRTSVNRSSGRGDDDA